MVQNPPKNYLIESILVTVFCCQPFGIVGIVYASQVNSKYASGDYEGAKRSSKEAKKWMTWGVISGLIIAVGFLLLYGSIFFAMLSQGSL
tara:strand:+ start:44996 stop:45265 length:270 start_codon:yes stop_codon:yes gene_type:complete